MGFRVAVAGASGYAGGELLRLLAGHPQFELAAITGHGTAGSTVAEVHPHLVTLADRVLAPTTAASLSGADLVFLALPHGQSGALAAQLPAHVKVVDLGADHRLTDPAQWAAYYGGEHAGAWTYGLPELPGQRGLISAAERVAATGCYAATIILALDPLLASGIASPDDIVVVAASGTSGAGTNAKKHLLGSEVMGDLTGYKVGAHQHVPEIKQATGARSLSMTPILAPMPRGILATVTAKPMHRVTEDEVRDVLIAAYAEEPFVFVQKKGQQPHTAATYGSNAVHLQAVVDLDSGRIIVTSALDNLGKGAAGQAVQCANLMLGLPETTGLPINGVAP
ncbi:N-acetyl-gamma-glutamyl-phosphate reductase [Longispora fulva]|uniref:N-acetyl-gamma-glutamyl-phosphate reductase n=1 Tax=Longispora fulva TaxID=619741 RepID=A0A8J7KZX7_9ACTN|nr:N-acetyl-gamma-glutamyl-phosphate reductase [Longispora fulva]MBG6141872.1 N-acetyl-gamma-glutamyl-phosphate reductase [Longispora fulva]GIG58972.1 N-acetyl-gamma-glutamyl-phosphate reductase [Longispora fulva]